MWGKQGNVELRATHIHYKQIMVLYSVYACEQVLK